MATNTNTIQTPIALVAIRLGITDNPPFTVLMYNNFRFLAGLAVW
jgi:hypothetical protein